jgi:hypothetical protein
MLKLEKASDLSNITIRMREREHFFEPRLLKALAIALILHTGGLLFFHVTPFFFTSTFTFPPIHVKSDSPVKGVSAQVSHAREEEEILPPPLSLVPSLDWISISPISTLVPSINFDPHALQFLEERVWPKWQEPLTLKLEEPRIQLAISGDIAELPLVKTDPMLSQMEPLFPQTSPAYVTYQVQLDEKTGEIFWYERTESSAVTAIDQLTEKILLNLRFLPPSNPTVIKGSLHFAVLQK